MWTVSTSSVCWHLTTTETARRQRVLWGHHQPQVGHCYCHCPVSLGPGGRQKTIITPNKRFICCSPCDKRVPSRNGVMPIVFYFCEDLCWVEWVKWCICAVSELSGYDRCQLVFSAYRCRCHFDCFQANQCLVLTEMTECHVSDLIVGKWELFKMRIFYTERVWMNAN